MRICSSIAGKFTRVSKTTYRDGVVLVAFCGNLYPHDLTDMDVQHIKDFYYMPTSEHTLLNDWPGEIEPAYPAAKTNYHNGFLLIKEATA